MRFGIQKHTSTFTYSHKKILFHFWSHTDNVAAPDTIIFLGSGQIGKIPKWVAELSPAGTIVVDGLPHWEAHPSARDLKDLTHDYTINAFHIILNTFEISSANIIGISQAAPGVIWLAKKLSNKIKNVALVIPLGLTPNIFGDSPQARLKKLKKRSLQTVFEFSHSPFYDLRNLYISFMLLRKRLSESEPDASDNKYAAGLSYDLREDCRDLANKQFSKGNSFTIFLGEKDKIFPPHEVLASLKEADIKHLKSVIIPNISHPSLAVRGSEKILAQIINIVRQQ